jgi:hypothetical protein
MNNIIQTNCPGLKVNFIEITLLVQAFLPVAFCLQEKHLKKSDTINLNNYSVYSTYVDEDERAAGGSTILVQARERGGEQLSSPLELREDEDLLLDLPLSGGDVSITSPQMLVSQFVSPSFNDFS